MVRIREKRPFGAVFIFAARRLTRNSLDGTAAAEYHEIEFHDHEWRMTTG
jgi:hypothetical protein